MDKKILIVDNSKVFLRIVSHHLKRKGYEVATAEDGLAALEVLETLRPSVIFVDLVMPRINGEKLCRLIKMTPEFARVPLVIVSAIAAEERIDFRAFGADACIAKGPFGAMKDHIDTVLARIEAGDLASLHHTIFGAERIAERQITKELIAVGKHFEITLDHMEDGFLELTPDATIVFANRVAAALLRGSEERILSASLPGFFSAEDRSRLRTAIRHLGDESVSLGEDDPLQLNSRLLLLKLVPFTDQGQRFVIVLIHDITRRKQVEWELHQYRGRLEKLVAVRTAALEKKNEELRRAHAEVKVLSGLLPICASCKMIRDDRGYWNRLESYIKQHSEAEFSHSLCPECAKKLYPQLYADKPDR